MTIPSNLPPGVTNEDIEKAQAGPRDLTAIAEAVTAYRCTECQEISEDSQGPVYECSCGNTFSKEENGSHRCPDCNKFAGKLADDSLDCGCNAEAEELTVYACEGCDELVPEDEAKAHECGVEQPPKPVAETKPPFTIGQRVRVRPGVTIAVIHESLGEFLDPPQPGMVPCYGPAKVMGYTNAPIPWLRNSDSHTDERVALRCETHSYDGAIHANFLEAMPGTTDDPHEHTWGQGELSGSDFEQCGVCFRVQRKEVIA